jgi:hypothetical protein
MAGLAEGLALVHSPPLVRVKRVASGSFKDWLRTGTFVPATGGGNLRLTQLDWGEYLGFVARDVDRLALAGRETLQSIVPVPRIPHSVAWSLIKAYYAAF